MQPGDGHEVYWEECGHPEDKPAVVLHGGPGSGATPWWRQFFDPDAYRVILMDQRGCGRSRPNASETRRALENNTTAHLIRDLEQLRAQLRIERWLVFGASWGSTLGLAYAVEHPECVSELVLRAVVTTRGKDIDWLTHTMGEIYPWEFDRLAGIPTYLLRGRLDIASPLRSAYEIAQGIPGAQLDIVETDAHGAGDDTVDRIIAVLDRCARP